MDMDKGICPCMGITYGDVKEAVKNGITTVEALQEKTYLGTCCGRCLEKIDAVLTEFKAS